jgi:hypothetical protein
MEIKVITYEESRFEFFKRELKMSENKLARIERKRFANCIERMRMLSDVGEEVSYYRDIVKMLEENVK